jgi:hypothetical protein
VGASPPEQGGNLLGIDFVVFGFTTVDGFHIKGMSQDERNALFRTEVGEPISGEDAFNGHDQPLTIGSNDLEEGF